jgi:adenosylcobinamide-phosphate synthase
MKPSARFAAAYILDLLAGDPPWLPHPVRAIGAAIDLGDRVLPHTFAAGAALTAAVVAGSWAAARRFEILLAWAALATRDLLSEAGAVIAAVEAHDLPLARGRVARIVGRDTAELDESEILRAVVETLAESLCDGIVAPIFYLALGGVPLAWAYKAANTLDSTIGHPEPPYTDFGRAAARLDDAANFIPARLAALAIVAFAPDRRRAWRVLLADGHKHPSPNAGRTEAAMAGALGVELGGLNYYGGEPSPKPLLNAGARRPTVADARRAWRIAGLASLAAFSAAWLFLRWKERRP